MITYCYRGNKKQPGSFPTHTGVRGRCLKREVSRRPPTIKNEGQQAAKPTTFAYSTCREGKGKMREEERPSRGRHKKRLTHHGPVISRKGHVVRPLPVLDGAPILTRAHARTHTTCIPICTRKRPHAHSQPQPHPHPYPRSRTRYPTQTTIPSETPPEGHRAPGAQYKAPYYREKAAAQRHRRRVRCFGRLGTRAQNTTHAPTTLTRRTTAKRLILMSP